MYNINPAYEIERLLQFGQKWNLLEKWDIVPARNSLLDLLQISEPYTVDINEKVVDSPTEILNNLLDYAAEAGILTEDTLTFRDLLDTRIMGLLTPAQSKLIRKFYDTAKKQSIEKATDDYYMMSIKSNYIRMDRIAKNLYWQTPTNYGDIEITVNLSKPEKDPRTIAAARSTTQSNYPKCLLCLENVGYSGRVDHPARQNHRVIPVTLDDEQWYLQYSPYVYYNEHCIVFSEQHRPMKVSERTFARLLDFIQQLPHYFLGSNADLPIVGGSILSHDHFQGGRHTFTMEKAETEKTFTHMDLPDVKAGIVKWPMSVVRLSGNEKDKLIKTAAYLLGQWREYSDADAEILAYSIVNGEKVPHNTVTPIARMNKNNEFELDLVLRNNRTSQEYPDGIFHPHKELQHIKKENIGLIEVMGLAVLPGRLAEEMKAIELIITGEKPFNEDEIIEDEKLKKHLPWIIEMIGKYGINNNKAEAHQILQNEIGGIFARVLEDSGVYKRNDKGMNSFVKFMNHLGFK